MCSRTCNLMYQLGMALCPLNPCRYWIRYVHAISDQWPTEPTRGWREQIFCNRLKDSMIPAIPIFFVTPNGFVILRFHVIPWSNETETRPAPFELFMNGLFTFILRPPPFVRGNHRGNIWVSEWILNTGIHCISNPSSRQLHSCDPVVTDYRMNMVLSTDVR